MYKIRGHSKSTFVENSHFLTPLLTPPLTPPLFEEPLFLFVMKIFLNKETKKYFL